MINNPRRFTEALVLALGLIVLCLSLAVNGGVTDPFDALVRNGVHQSSSPTFIASMQFVTRFGSGAILTMLFAVYFIYLFLIGRRGSARTLAITMAAAIVFENGLKLIVHRARPEPFFGIAAPETYSFPSGHTLFSTCFYGVAASIMSEDIANGLIRVAFWTSASAIVLVIAFSRVYLGVHYPTDVVGGILVGAALVCGIRAEEHITSNGSRKSARHR